MREETEELLGRLLLGEGMVGICAFEDPGTGRDDEEVGALDDEALVLEFIALPDVPDDAVAEEPPPLVVAGPWLGRGNSSGPRRISSSLPAGYSCRPSLFLDLFLSAMARLSILSLSGDKFPATK